MGGKFIYVFSKEDMTALLLEGYTLLKSDDKSGLYVFANDNDKIAFSHSEMQYVNSDTLSF